MGRVWGAVLAEGTLPLCQESGLVPASPPSCSVHGKSIIFVTQSTVSWRLPIDGLDHYLMLPCPSEVAASVRYNRRPTCPDTSVGAHLPTPPPSRHRKSHSLGNNMMCQFSVVESKSATFPTEKPRHLLDDSFLESHSPARNHTHNSVFTNGMSRGTSPMLELQISLILCGPYVCHTGPQLEASGREFPPQPELYIQVQCSVVVGVFVPGANSSYECSSLGSVTMEGPLRRKTLLKEGRKPTLSSWTRYWIALSGSTLIYFGAKALRASERKHYKSTPCKKITITGWMVVLPDDPEHPNIFQLNDPDKGEPGARGNVYKFQTGSRFSAIIWHKHLEEACRSIRPQVCAVYVISPQPEWNRYQPTLCHLSSCHPDNMPCRVKCQPHRDGRDRAENVEMQGFTQRKHFFTTSQQQFWRMDCMTSPQPPPTA
ncbi:hypothetical protein JZ751_001301 [Albula glossodonta]|uniref:PH domain-containing protein n=1 Tax=Albula glossodonta TaxID=121402 RepID=A0A8T2PTI6_9TELE|nr:hypothetical protein JZ751_001301 [Albula glossodonta]